MGSNMLCAKPTASRCVREKEHRIGTVAGLSDSRCAVEVGIFQRCIAEHCNIVWCLDSKQFIEKPELRRATLTLICGIDVSDVADAAAL